MRDTKVVTRSGSPALSYKRKYLNVIPIPFPIFSIIYLCDHYKVRYLFTILLSIPSVCH